MAAGILTYDKHDKMFYKYIFTHFPLIIQKKKKTSFLLFESKLVGEYF